MRTTLISALAVVLALGLTACSPTSQEGSAVLLPVADDPTVTFKVWFKVGSQNDPAGKEGLAALTGAMISEGATTENTYEEILEKLYPLASSYNVSVDREMTVLSGRTHKDNLDAFYQLLTDAYLRPAFKEEDFNRLKTNTLNYLEKSLRYSSDEELGKAVLYSSVFAGTGYAHPEEGLVESLNAINLDDVKSFYARYYTRDNAVVALGGGYDESLVAKFEESLQGLPEGMPEPIAAPQLEPFEGRHVTLVSKPGNVSSISFGFPIDVHRGEPDFYALWVANSWLGEHRNSSSHLYQVIRETRGMNYGDYSYIEAFPRGGYRQMPPTHVGRRQQIFEVWIRTVPDQDAHFALRAALREVKKLVDDGMSEEDFQLTRSFLKKYVLHFADTTAARLGYAVDDRFYGIDGEGHLARFRETMDSLTREEVNAAVKKHLQYDKLKIAIVTGAADKLKEALVSDAPSPKKYPSKKPDTVLEEDKEIQAFPLKIAADNARVIPVEEIFQK